MKSVGDQGRQEPPVSLDVPAQNSRVKEPRGSGHTVPPVDSRTDDQHRKHSRPGHERPDEAHPWPALVHHLQEPRQERTPRASRHAPAAETAIP